MLKSKSTLLVVVAIGILLHATPLTPGASSQSEPTKKTTAKKSQPATAKKTSRNTSSATAGRTDRTTSSADPSPATKGTAREELRGIWITTDSPRDWDAVMKKLKDHNLNAAFVRIGQGGKVIYPSKILPQDQWSADTGEDELAKAVAAARRHGIQFHAWKVCFVMNSARSPKAGRAANEFYDTIAREDRLVRDPKGVQGAWLDPSDPRNQDLEARVAREVASKYELDGYHLDYIRYPDLKPGFDFHYGAVARREFEKELGRAVANWPTDVISGSLKLRYEDWERDNITRLVRRLGPEIKSQRPGTLLSAAVFRNIHAHRAKLKQDWPRWCREGLLDFVVPMSYETDLDTFRTVTRRDLSYACGRTPYMAGIGGYLLYKPEAVVDQVQAARELGTDGFVIFSINDPTDDSGMTHKGLVDRQLALLAAGPTRTRAVPGLGGPRFEFQLSPEVVNRRYEPAAIEAGGSTPVGIRLANSSQTSDVPIAVTVSVEDLRGRTLDEPLKVSLASGEEISLGLTASATAVRPVIRGVVGEGKKPFVVRGPIVEPVSASDLADLRDRELPPEPTGPGLAVGVYSAGLGSDGIFEALQGAKGIAPVRIYHLEPTHLASVQVFVLPQFFDLSDMTPKVAETLRTWVQGGGRLILTHDAVGLRWHPRLFPEVGRGVKLSSSRTLQVATALRGFTKGAHFDHEYADHAQLEPGPSAKVLLAEQKTGKPVVASGRVGKGTVVLNGLIPGYEQESDPNSNSSRLLIALVNYLKP